MAEPSVLIVYFSRTGTTRGIAHEIHHALELRGVRSELEELREPGSRRGMLGYFRSAIDASRDRPAELVRLTHDPSHYDLVVLGTPVWAASPSTPVRAFLRAYAGGMKRIAFFLTHGGSGRDRTFGRMRVLAGQAPTAELALREHEIARDRHHRAIRAFAEDIASDLGRSERETHDVHGSLAP